VPKHKGVEIEDIAQGTGPEASRGSVGEIRYDGFLRRGDKFQESLHCRFKIGTRYVIAGLEYGVQGMRTGGRHKIYVSPHLAYGTQGVPAIVPANAALIFEVELLTVKEELDLSNKECKRWLFPSNSWPTK
jgi:FKBP-type peptidyl-prolyl cis-trans isomerase